MSGSKRSEDKKDKKKRSRDHKKKRKHNHTSRSSDSSDNSGESEEEPPQPQPKALDRDEWMTMVRLLSVPLQHGATFSNALSICFCLAVHGR